MASSFSAYQENPKNTTFQNQEEGEKVLLLLREHPIVNLSWLVPSLFGLAAPPALIYLFGLLSISVDKILPPAFQPLAAAVYYIFLLSWVHLSFLRWFFNVYLVTDRRVVDLDYWGFLFFRLSAAAIAQIEDVTYTVRGGWGVFFNYGDLYIQTAGTETNFDFHKVPHPAKVAHVIMGLIRRERMVS